MKEYKAILQSDGVYKMYLPTGTMYIDEGGNAVPIYQDVGTQTIDGLQSQLTTLQAQRETYLQNEIDNLNAQLDAINKV